MTLSYKTIFVAAKTWKGSHMLYNMGFHVHIGDSVPLGDVTRLPG